MDAMSAAPGRFDMLLTELAQQHGSVESLMDSFFDFLYRKTDFYVVAKDPERHKMGFLPGQAQEKVLKAFQKYPMKILDGNDSNNMIAKKNTATIDQVVSAASSIKASCGAKNEPKLTDEGKQFPVGNGGRAGTFTWTQTLEEVSIQMELVQGTQAKDLDCRITSTHLYVALKSNTTKPLLEGEFPEQIRVDESIWSLESNHTLLILLEKTKPTWWASALKGEPEIDTNQVDSRRSIYEYDEVTQGAIRKAVYDQRQYQSNGRVPLTPEEQMLQTAKDLPGSPFLSSTQ
ncbi:hypothetical protein KXD40_003998 [Peronospora effusa]|uniref:CS domain-containing protein n=1 Tax=Peronospora effusa TaxID=542832 RepID=A0A3M6VUD6_9STRA|nr:hypothetical protein DD238_000375 [Peronospora effusa]RQM15936.1 hypothetical protein DD237_006231 [Peronospora effusa]UIZ22678.1 hypothetical protein KXD40_003998 [Peronospora effusa]CAI5703019.1 unnamed protein product [Peronospora effusa]